MMKKNLFKISLLFTMAMLTVVFNSCSKDDDSSDNNAVTGISLNVTTLTLNISEEQILTATVTPDNASITWTSSNTAVATVADGKVTAVAAGSATITAKAGDKTATCTVTVTTVVEKKYLPSSISLIDTYSTDGGSYSREFTYTYNEKNQITKIISSSYNLYYTYEYDTNGNLSIQKEVSTNNGTIPTTYTYSTGQVVAKEYYNTDNPNVYDNNIYTLNNVNAATKSSYWNTTYTYDANYNLIKVKDMVTNNTMKYNDKKGVWSSLNMPLWFQFEMPDCLWLQHSLVNSLTEFSIDDQNAIEGTFTVQNTYDVNGYPSKVEYIQNEKIAFTFNITYVEAN